MRSAGRVGLTPMGEVAGLLVLLAGLVVIFRKLLGGAGSLLAPRRGRPPGGVGVAGAFLAGLLGVFAVTQLALDDPATVNPLSPVAFAMGVLAVFLTAGGWLRRVAQWALSLLGAVASLPALVDLVAGPDCGTAVPLVGRLASAALLVVFAAVGVGLAALSGRLNGLVGLGWFGAVEVLAFLQSPGGIDLLELGGWSLVTGLAAAVSLGLVGGKRPELVVSTAGVVILFAQVGLIESGLGCGSPPGAGVGGLLSLTLPYLVSFVLSRLATRWVGPR